MVQVVTQEDGVGTMPPPATEDEDGGFGDGTTVVIGPGCDPSAGGDNCNGGSICELKRLLGWGSIQHEP